MQISKAGRFATVLVVCPAATCPVRHSRRRSVPTTDLAKERCGRGVQMATSSNVERPSRRTNATGIRWVNELHSKEMHRMTIVNIQARRDAFRTKGRLDDGPGASFDQNPRIDDDKDMPPGHDDQARFARLVLPHLGAAYSLARWITGSRADAEDVVQDACLRAFRAIGGFAGDNAPPWVLTIVTNAAYTWLRKNRPSAVLVVDDLESVEIAQANH